MNINLQPIAALLVTGAFFFMGCNSSNNDSANQSRNTGSQGHLEAQYYYSGFDSTSNTYKSISTASDGKVHYVLSSGSYYVGGQYYTYDPSTDEIEHIADLTVASGEGDANMIPHGKSHVDFYEKDGYLYFATHIGVYEFINGIELIPRTLPDGVEPYPGGHFLSYNMESGEFENLATAPNGEGILTMVMDEERGHLYGLTWPGGRFLHYDPSSGELVDKGPVAEGGEAGTPGEDFRVIARGMFVDSGTGVVYYSTAEGDIFGYDPSTEEISQVEGVDLRKDYFGQYDPTVQGSMAYHWRNIVWNEGEQAAYGVHPTSGYLFRFDPREPSIEVLQRITSEPSQRAGMFDRFYYGYLGFDLGPDGETIYYLTGGPIYDEDGNIVTDESVLIGARGLENLHLVTYHIPTGTYTDHGKILYPDGEIPTYANSITVDHQGNVYTIANHERNGEMVMDLVKIPNPFEQ